MLIKGLVLTLDSDLEYAIHFKSNVAVWQGKVLIETGIVQSFSKEAVKINDAYVLRRLCDLRVL